MTKKKAKQSESQSQRERDRGQGRYEENVRKYQQSGKPDAAAQEAEEALDDPEESEKLRQAIKKGKERAAESQA